MRVSKYFFILICLFFSFSSIFAKKRFSKDEFKQKRTEFLKRELDLSAQEAAKFIPLSEELMDKKFLLNKEAREEAQSLRGKSNVSDAEYEQVIDTWVNNRVKAAVLEKEYYQKFKRILPMRKLRKYQEVDMKFMRSVMNRPEKR